MSKATRKLSAKLKEGREIAAGKKDILETIHVAEEGDILQEFKLGPEGELTVDTSDIIGEKSALSKPETKRPSRRGPESVRPGAHF